ncbi:nucleotidyltransferase PLUS glutamate rich protein GrpB PLUS ribosomal protein alanine acetyltransferase [Legionella steigerwaltii]|uniref:Aminoglycoside (3'') (9) adenylyltransferase n=1 Tax=Legionella steigerwaltii TaxID=460 RepID=A0A378LDM1_9GAMM|nr:aminoglycoside adenylyltransferase domain-containing protein [Legionella steigerwaltii]KTD71701.1 multifunctional nucleotidyltransferase/glutamate rich protein GrpB/ribosomal protein alanine acetyltransferase [Legionella steigerwaltii]STY23869.1 nucleotidyltransferase PLUS glutamate rich protein GrpB PLUS ribosomal protein alanine acetyltransferase [Legionella steigerwaltii]
MSYLNFATISPYHDINLILEELSFQINQTLGNKLIGLYLFGSLVYGDFKEGRSDLDLVAIVKQPLNEKDLEQVKKLHRVMGEDYPKWKERVECSYTPIHMLAHVLPPEEPRPYYGGGIFYVDADYGNEWIINNYLLSMQSIPLIGPDFHSLINPIDIIDVQKACIKDLFKEWEPKIHDPEWLSNSHYRSYIVMNLCRIFYTVYWNKTASKTVSAVWIKRTYIQWKELIEAAEAWEYGKTMSYKNEVIDFIKFIVNEIKKTELYECMQ